MRTLISFCILFGSFTSLLAQPAARFFPNMVVFQPDEKDPYIEVLYTGSPNKFESGLKNNFRGDGDKELSFTKDDDINGKLVMEGITQPVFTGSSYSLSIETVQSSKRGKLLRIRLFNSEPAFNLLNPKMGNFRKVMEIVQDIIDDTRKVSYFEEDQQANTMYLFTPPENEKNLSSYLFMYSKEPIDTTMKKLSEWMAHSTEKPRAGSWVNDSTFRIDNLKQPAFGLGDPFSMTIVHSVVQDDYHQYVIYLGNYIAPGDENNYQVRPHDVHKRLWRYYNTLLILEKSQR